MTLLNVISHPSSSHTKPKLLARECDATNLIRRVFSVNNFLHPANTLRSQKRKFFEFSIKIFLGAKRNPPEGWFHEPRSEAESALRKITARSHLRTHVIVSKSCERRVRHARMYIHAPKGCMYPHRRCGLRAAERSGECATKKKNNA